MTDTPTPDDRPRTPSGVPEGMFLELPKPSVPGEQIPPIPVEFGVALTDKDAKGRRWMLFQVGDGTVTMTARIPWQVAAQQGAILAQAFAQMQVKAAQEESAGLVLPPGAGRQGGLFVPNGHRRGPAVPPLNGGGPRV